MDLRMSRLLITGAAIGTVVGTGRAALNRTHVFNAAWPPHARFHAAAGWGTVVSAQLVSLWLVWRPNRDVSQRDLAIKTAALLPTIAWVPAVSAVGYALHGVARGGRTQERRVGESCRANNATRSARSRFTQPRPADTSRHRLTIAGAARLAA
jgi:hypothetical protein